MGETAPAGALTKRALRILLIRSTTFQAVSVTLMATVATVIFKVTVKQDPGAWTWAVPFLPVLGFLLKRFLLFAYHEAAVHGVRINAQRFPLVPGLLRSVAAWHGLPRPDVVGFGERAEIVVTVRKSVDLRALGHGRIVRRQKVSVKVGTPLLLTLSSRQIAVLLSFHLAVLHEPFPVEAGALTRRQAEYAVAEPGSRKARRGVALAEKTRGFTADVNARGLALAERAAGSRQAAQDVFATAAIVMRDFGAVEERFRTLVLEEQPWPSAFYFGWAVSRRAVRSMCPGEVPIIESLSMVVDEQIVAAWRMTALSPWRRLIPGSADDDEQTVAPEHYDYAWLLADPYGTRGPSPVPQRSAWSQY